MLLASHFMTSYRFFALGYHLKFLNIQCDFQNNVSLLHSFWDSAVKYVVFLSTEFHSNIYITCKLDCHCIDDMDELQYLIFFSCFCFLFLNISASKNEILYNMIQCFNSILIPRKIYDTSNFQNLAHRYFFSQIYLLLRCYPFTFLFHRNQTMLSIGLPLIFDPKRQICINLCMYSAEHMGLNSVENPQT